MTQLSTTPVETLLGMLAYKRRANSKAESAFIARYIAPLGAKPDTFGNYVLRIGETPILFSSHTDSVHKDGGMQRLTVIRDNVTVSDTRSNCLGADDGVGVWIMREMILAKRPGLYVFHRQEESGGIGSDFIATCHPQLLQGIKAAIAFDRRGTSDVITHQAGGRCASDAFAKSLATQLGTRFRPSADGIFTDTANYTGLIGECTNISVGYSDEHTARETQSLSHALHVRAAMLAFDATKLTFERQPGEPDADAWSYLYDDADQLPARYGAGNFTMLEKLVKLNPAEVADILLDYGYDADMLADEIYQRGGMVPTH